MVFGMSSSSTLLLNSKVLLPNPAAKFESPKLKLRTTQLETTPDHLSCTVVFEFFNTSDVSFSAANSSSLVASYSSRCFSNRACVSWCSSSRLRFGAAAYQNENCVMLMIAFDVKTTASRRLKLRTIQLETTPDHLSCTVVFEFLNTSDVSFSAANSSSLVLRHLCSLLHLLFIHVLFFLLLHVCVSAQQPTRTRTALCS